MAVNNVIGKFNFNDPKEIFKATRGTEYLNLKNSPLVGQELTITDWVCVHVESTKAIFDRLYMITDCGKFFTSSKQVIDTLTDWCKLVDDVKEIKVKTKFTESSNFPGSKYVSVEII